MRLSICEASSVTCFTTHAEQHAGPPAFIERASDWTKLLHCSSIHQSGDERDSQANCKRRPLPFPRRALGSSCEMHWLTPVEQSLAATWLGRQPLVVLPGFLSPGYLGQFPAHNVQSFGPSLLQLQLITACSITSFHRWRLVTLSPPIEQLSCHSWLTQCLPTPLPRTPETIG
jgi:hypothetical protein